MNVTEPFTARLGSTTTGAAPLVTPFLPAWRSYGGLSLVIFAGGGYARRAEHEGAGYAEFFAGEGIPCFVVDYRVAPNRHPAMIEDAYAAIETVRLRADEFGIDPDKVGVIGSSAGGHLAAHTLVGWRDYASAVSLRPALGVLCYPVIYLDGRNRHSGSAANLLGEQPGEEACRATAVADRITAETPPCFIWHTLGDATVPVENSLGFAQQLQQHDVPYELHVYQRPGHGISRKNGLCWSLDCLRWLRERTEGRPWI